MSDRLLSIKDLNIAYGDQAVPTVENFDLEAGHSEIISIVGESGSGKTSVIRAIMGLLPSGGKVTGGEILFQGRSLLSLSKEEWRDLRGTDISMIFQDSRSMIDPIRKIGTQFVEYIRTHEPMSKAAAYQRGLEMLEKMKLADAKNIMESYSFQLSGGMCQRVGIAMAMVFSPKLLLADEPTSALDVTIQAQIVRQIMELRDRFNTSVMIVTHNIGVAAYMADQMIVMQNGKIVDRGTRDEVMKDPASDYTKSLLDAVPELGGRRYV
ncbi:MAG: ABC transporter ATP-binding protein [Peptostreptococcaceae bacterium]|nr:ABC transporter ATP-binding protein [Peptostreptococcaceae bacterium]